MICRALGCLAALGAVLLTAPARAADDPNALAAAAYAVLDKNCAKCHDRGQAEGGFGYVLDSEQLVARKKVLKGKAAESKLIKAINDKPMPPEDEKQKPTAEDLTALAKWIDAGAPAFPKLVEVKTREVLSEKAVIGIMRDHLREVPIENQRFYRYFTIAHFHNNPAVSNETLRLYRAALSKALNSLNWKSEIVLPKALDKYETVFAIDLREFVDWRGQDWDKRYVWNEILKHYPYGLEQDGHREEGMRTMAKEVRRATGTAVPCVRVDWFVAVATRPELYHTILNLPDHAVKLEHILGVRFQDNFERDQLARAAFVASGISTQNRMVERHSALYGAYWKSYDFKSNVGDGNLLKYPLGPKFPGNKYDDQAFVHDGGEMIFHLPNGMQGYLLTDGQNRRIDEGPTTVVRDKNETSGSIAIVNGLSCMACHRHGMIRDSVKDEIRNGSGVGGDALDKVQRLYVKRDAMDALMLKDEQRFLRALDEAVGPFLKVDADKDRKITEFEKEPIGEVARAYNRDLTLAAVAFELGFTDPNRLKTALEDNQRLRTFGLGSLAEGGTLKREMWSSRKEGLTQFHRAASTLGRGTPHLPF